MSADQDSSSPKTTWAVILGASQYPKSPALADLPEAETSTKCFFGYLTRDFRLPNENVLNLFDTDESPSDQLRVIGNWLTTKHETVKDLIVFYSGSRIRC